jgi:hypothetical protein
MPGFWDDEAELQVSINEIATEMAGLEICVHTWKSGPTSRNDEAGF